MSYGMGKPKAKRFICFCRHVQGIYFHRRVEVRAFDLEGAKLKTLQAMRVGVIVTSIRKINRKGFEIEIWNENLVEVTSYVYTTQQARELHRRLQEGNILFQQRSSYHSDQQESCPR